MVVFTVALTSERLAGIRGTIAGGRAEQVAAEGAPTYAKLSLEELSGLPEYATIKEVVSDKLRAASVEHHIIPGEGRDWLLFKVEDAPEVDEAGALEAETAALLEGDETYACLLTVPGIGPRTAAQLAVSVDIGRFPDHDHLASYCGIAPRVRSSGTSVRSVRASRRGDARLKSLLIFSCNSLVRSSGRYGEYYRACRARGMGHGRALKAVARKRLRAIYAVMRDRVPYRE